MVRKLIIAVVSIAVAFAAWNEAAIALFSKFAPESALRMDAGAPMALVLINDLAVSQKDKKPFLRSGRQNAVRALAAEPLLAPALRQLGQYYALIGEINRGRELVALSTTLTRRDAVGQSWILEDSLRNGRTGATFRSIDVLLRTEPQTRESIYETFGTLLADPQFRKAFVRYSTKRPPWLKEFFAYNINTATQPLALARTLATMEPFPRALVTDDQLGQILSALVNTAPVEEARLLFQRIPDSDNRALTSILPQRAEDAFRYTPFGWELFNDSNGQGFGAMREKSIEIEAIALPGLRGIVARKLLFLKPGFYRLTARADLADMLDGAKGTVRVLCNTGPGKWAATANMELRTGPNLLDFSIMSDCAAQLIAIETLGSESQSDATMRLSAFSLAPLDSARPQGDAGQRTKPE